MHPDFPAHHLHQAPADRQTQAGAAELARNRRIRLLEGLEQSRLLLVGNPDSGIFHLEAEQQLITALLPQLRAQGHVPHGGKLAGIAEQVDQYLPQPGGIARNPQARQRWVHLLAQFQPGTGDAIPHHAAGVVDGSQQLKGHRFQPDVIGFDFRQIEDIVDQPQQVLDRVIDLVQFLQLFGPGELRAQQVGKAQGRVHRCADFVTHVGQEHALGTVCRLGPLAGFLGIPGALRNQLLKVLPIGPQFTLAVAALGNIANEGINAAATHPGPRRDHLHGKLAAIGPAVRGFEVSGHRPFPQGSQPVRHALFSIGGIKLPDESPYQLVPGKTGHAAVGTVDLENPPLRVHGPEAIRCALNGSPVLLLLLEQLALRSAGLQIFQAAPENTAQALLYPLQQQLLFIQKHRNFTPLGDAGIDHVQLTLATSRYFDGTGKPFPGSAILARIHPDVVPGEPYRRQGRMLQPFAQGIDHSLQHAADIATGLFGEVKDTVQAMLLLEALLQLVLGFTQCSDVPGDPKDPHQDAGATENRNFGGEIEAVNAAVGTLQTFLHHHDLARRHGFRVSSPKGLGDIAGEEIEVRTANHLPGGAAQQTP